MPDVSPSRTPWTGGEERPTAIAALLAGLEDLGGDVYRPRRRASDLFGGMLLARSVQAACETVPGARLHAIQGRFLNAGRHDRGVELHVERLREGALLTNRRVELKQEDLVLFTLDASFGLPPESGEFQVPGPAMPPIGGAAPAPTLDNDQNYPGFDASIGFELREAIGAMEGEDERVTGRSRRAWVRPTMPLPDDQHVLATVVALLADMRTGWVATESVDEPRAERATSLNHAMWFHRPVPAQGWWRHHTRPISTSRRLALVQGSVHDEAGALCATYLQELLLRRPPGVPPEG